MPFSALTSPVRQSKSPLNPVNFPRVEGAGSTHTLQFRTCVIRTVSRVKKPPEQETSITPLILRSGF